MFSINLVLVMNLDVESKYIRYIGLTENPGYLVYFKEEVEKILECVARVDLNLVVS
jgi:hypothetical protein